MTVKSSQSFAPRPPDTIAATSNGGLPSGPRGAGGIALWNPDDSQNSPAAPQAAGCPGRLEPDYTSESVPEPPQNIIEIFGEFISKFRALDEDKSKTLNDFV